MIRDRIVLGVNNPRIRERRDRTVLGVNNPRIQERLQREDNLDLDSAIRICQAEEAAQKQVQS